MRFGVAARYRWTARDVVDVQGAELVVRTYLEQADVRAHLRRVVTGHRLSRVCDVGAGYGRMSLVLREFCDHVVAFEREPGLALKGRFLQPGVDFRAVGALDRLPAGDGEFDLALTFTVLQHMTNEAAAATLAEVRRVVRPGGHVLLCEESHGSDVDSQSKPPWRLGGHFTVSRDIERYVRWMAPFTLISLSRRNIEPGYPRPDVGNYFLFASPPAGRGVEG